MSSHRPLRCSASICRICSAPCHQFQRRLIHNRVEVDKAVRHRHVHAAKLGAPPTKSGRANAVRPAEPGADPPTVVLIAHRLQIMEVCDSIVHLETA